MSLVKTMIQPRDDHGQFASKFDEPKKLYAYRLTDSANQFLEQAAKDNNCTKTEVIESFARGGFIKDDIVFKLDQFIALQARKAGGNQHKPAGELNLNSVHWRKLREFKEWIENDR